jgi:hypothetical protein
MGTLIAGRKEQITHAKEQAMSFRTVRTGITAHVPEPPENNPQVPPEAPPPGAPGKEVELPPREEPDKVREPGTPRPADAPDQAAR